MKASIKFRDEQKPLMRAKVPIKMMSLPLRSGVVVGDSKEMSLNLSTGFDSGPCLKFSYKPNDSRNPFSFVCKMGIGHYGSPNSSPFVMSAEFNLLGSQNPKFLLHFKPRIGDFLAKKSCSSVDFIKEGTITAVVPSQGAVKSGGFDENGFFGNGKVGIFPVDPAAAETAAAAVGSVFSGIRFSAKTVLPVGNRALVNLRWGVRVQPDAVGEDLVMVGKGGDRTAGIFAKKFPFPSLVMDKIRIEHVAGDDSKGMKVGTGADLAGVCLDMKKQLEVIQTENGLLRKALDDLRSDIAAGKSSFSFGGGGRGDRRERKSKQPNGGGYGGIVLGEGEDMSEELNKLGAAGA